MIPLIVIRPQPGADATVAAARELGLGALACPLFAIEPVAWQPPDPAGVDALLIGSANAVRHAGPALARFGDKPAHVVGQATAAACRVAGLTVASVGVGGLQAVLDGVPPSRLLRLAGREHVPLTPPPGVTLIQRVVYANEPLRIGDELAERLRTPGVVMLHSAEAARHFASECDRLGIDRGSIAIATIGARVSAVAGPGWADLATAPTPDDAALLAQAAHLCQNPGDWRGDEGRECRTQS